MHHDQSNPAKEPFSVSLVDELTLVAGAQRLRSEYIGQLFRRWFCGSMARSTQNVDTSFASTGGLRPRQS